MVKNGEAATAKSDARTPPDYAKTKWYAYWDIGCKIVQALAFVALGIAGLRFQKASEQQRQADASRETAERAYLPNLRSMAAADAALLGNIDSMLVAKIHRFGGRVAAATNDGSEGAMCSRRDAEQLEPPQGGSAAGPTDRRLGSLRGQLAGFLSCGRFLTHTVETLNFGTFQRLAHVTTSLRVAPTGTIR